MTDAFLGEARSANRCVYVVDDEAGVRMAVTHALEDMGYAAWSFAGGGDLLEALGMIEPGCVLLDVQMPGMSGIDAMENLRRRGCDWPVIVMTAHGDVPLAVKAMKLGALEFIEKPFSSATLAPLLAHGFATWEERKLRHDARDAALSRLKALTPREQSVLHELAEGKQNKLVAHKLGLSVRTVEMHRANLLSKLGLRTPQEAVALLLRAQADAGTSMPATSA